MLNRRLCFISKPLHNYKVYWEESLFIPHVKDYVNLHTYVTHAGKVSELNYLARNVYTYLSQKITLWIAFKIQSSICPFVYVDLTSFARWSRTALSIRVRRTAELAITGQML